jgi:hypothetical protein
MSNDKVLVSREQLEQWRTRFRSAQMFAQSTEISEVLAHPAQDARTIAGAEPVEFDHRKDLACWFGLSYASFLVLPRVLMQEMPKDWQERIAVLLNEYDDAFPNQPDIGTTVQATKSGRLTKMPPWLLNYRHPARDEIAKLKGPSA